MSTQRLEEALTAQIRDYSGGHWTTSLYSPATLAAGLTYQSDGHLPMTWADSSRTLLTTLVAHVRERGWDTRDHLLVSIMRSPANSDWWGIHVRK